MSQVTSGLKIEKIDGNDVIIRTQTTYDENDPNSPSSVKETQIQVAIDEDDYNSLSSDLQGGAAGGRFYAIIKKTTRNSDGTFNEVYSDSISATEPVKKVLENRNSTLSRTLDQMSVDALVKAEPNTPQALWLSQHPTLENVGLGQLGNIQYDANGNVIYEGSDTQRPGTIPSFTIESFAIAAERQLEYETLCYPEDLKNGGQDRVVFSMFYQTGRSLNFDVTNADGNPFTFGKRNLTRIVGDVTLPIQSGIQDTNQVDYQRGTLNPVMGALASVALDPMQAIQQAAQIINMDIGEMQRALNTPASKNILTALRTYLAQTAIGAQGLIPRTTGAILNPNLELLLQAPQLRSFDFNFKMSARDRSEATQIRKIIRFFKQGMTVKRSPTSLFMVSPNMFRIRYKTKVNGEMIDHPSIGQIKDCALTAINTQYTPDGTYMTFDDDARTMTSYNIRMQFTELEPLTESNYTDDQRLLESSQSGPVFEDNTAKRTDSIGY